MNLDVRSLYPNFHAEATRHPSCSPRPTSGKGTGRKKKTLTSPLASPSKQRHQYRYGPAPTLGGGKPRLPTPSPTKRHASPNNNQVQARAEAPATSPLRRHWPASRGGEAMPPLSVGSRPPTPHAESPLRSVPSQRSLVRELSFKALQPTKQQQSCYEERPEDPAVESVHRTLPVAGKTTRSLVLRGDLAKDPTVVPSSRLSTVQTPPLAATTLPLEELVQCTARPRSRYARRDLATPMQMQPLPLPHRLSLSSSSSSSSSPSLPSSLLLRRPFSSSSSSFSSSSSETADMAPSGSNGLPLRGSQSTGSLPNRGHHHHQQQQQQQQPKATPILSWTDQDASSFFLTEVDAKQLADQWAIARAIARGSHLLYARGDHERAVASFADALALAQDLHKQQQQQQQQLTPQRDASADETTPLLALLHHHMGVAFAEDGQHKWALMMQKKALELAQQRGDAKLQARALKALGVLFLDRRDAARALECQQQALALAVDSRDAELEARVYANLGNLAAAQQQYEHAVACHERDLAASSSPPFDSAVGQARAHKNLSLVLAHVDGARDLQLEHELQAARLAAANAFETDMRRHADDVVGNIYWQLSSPDARLAEMVASSLTDVLAAKELEEEEE